MNVTIDSVTKAYGSQKAVDNISFNVKQGEVLGFLGPNGAGKSTTMKMITCYMTPSSGNIKVGEFNVMEEPDEVKKNIGYLPENNPLYLDMYIIDYLEFTAHLQGVEKSQIGKRVKEMIDLCGLGLEKHKKIGQLSKGYRQRVGLAQAMIHNPQLLILDEPTTGLDPNQIVDIRKLIKEMGRQKTVILSTHILSEVESTCDRILIINRGKIVADGTSETLRQRAQGNVITKVRIEGADKNTVFAALSEIPQVVTVAPLVKDNFYEITSLEDLDVKRNIFKLCVDKKWLLTEMTPIETRLEDIFRNLTLN